MRPKKYRQARHDDLFRARLDQVINLKHALVVLTDKIDWDWIDDQLAERFSAEGRPAEPVRFMIGMMLLKAIYALSDEATWDRWVHDPYFQYFTGEEFFQHTLPHQRSGLSHWRKRIGDDMDMPTVCRFHPSCHVDQLPTTFSECFLQGVLPFQV
jgi:transposase, IS5 family